MNNPAIGEPKERYIVREKVAEAPAVYTLNLSLEDGSIPRYLPGQFITVYFPELGTPEGKAYSISSAPTEKTLNITVKSMGEFSNRLYSLQTGDSLVASLPCGYFFSESSESALVLIAAGIGVAPFRGIIIDALRHDPRRKIFLFYSSRTISDIIFAAPLNKMRTEHSNLIVSYFLTRDEQTPKEMFRGRIRAPIILETIGDAPDPEFLICGSISFVRDLWRGLRNAGVAEERLYTEAFFSH